MRPAAPPTREVSVAGRRRRPAAAGMEDVYETLRVYYRFKGPNPHSEPAAPTEKLLEKSQDPWRPNSPLGARIMKTVEIHSQKPALYFLREAPAKGREVVVMKWDDIGIAAMRYAKGLYAMLRSLTARHSHAGRAIQVVPIVTNTATADSICIYLATLLIGAAPVFVWGACVSRAAAALKTLSPATVFIEGEGMHDQLKQADGLPASLSRIILVGASAAPAPAAAPPSAPAAPPSPMGAVQVLTWKNFLDGGDQLREPNNLSAVAPDEDGPAVVVLSSTYSRAAILSAKAVVHAAQNVAAALEIAESDSTLTVAPLAHATQLLFSVFVPQVTGCATYLIPDWRTFLTRPPYPAPTIYSLPAKLWEKLTKWLQAHLGSAAPEPAKVMMWQISVREVSGLSGARLAVSFASTLSPNSSLYITSHIGIPLSEVYGTAETAGAIALASRPAGGAPQQPPPLRLQPGVESALVGKELNVRGAGVCLSQLYPEPAPRTDGWLPLGDAAEMLSPSNLRLLGPTRPALAASELDAALAGVREHVLVDDVVVAEGGAAMVVALEPQILLSVALNMGCAPEVIRTAPFLRSMVQQHADAVFARFKQTAPEVILFPHAASASTSLPSHLLDAAPVLASVSADVAAANARAAAKPKDAKDLAAAAETPAVVRSRRLFNVHKMAAARAAQGKPAHKDAKREGERDRKEKERERNERDRSDREREARDKGERAAKDKDRKRDSRHRDRDVSKDKRSDSSAAKEDKRGEGSNNGKEGNTTSKDYLRPDSGAKSAGSEHKDRRRDSVRLAKDGAPLEKGHSGDSTPLSAVPSSEKLTASAPAPVAHLADSLPAPPRRATEKSVGSPATSPTAARAGLQRRDTMTIMALEMKEMPVAAAPPTPLSANKKGANKAGAGAYTEADMQAWFHEVLGTRVFQDGVSSAETLRDGIILCKLMQALRPGSIRKFNAMKGAFFQLENINFFLNACTTHMGISKNDLFDVRDLYDQANFVRVLHTIDMVHRVARTQAPAPAPAPATNAST